jgi:hypothetical protein
LEPSVINAYLEQVCYFWGAARRVKRASHILGESHVWQSVTQHDHSKLGLWSSDVEPVEAFVSTSMVDGFYGAFETLRFCVVLAMFHYVLTVCWFIGDVLCGKLLEVVVFVC